jgi:hypothetical protein
MKLSYMTEKSKTKALEVNSIAFVFCDYSKPNWDFKRKTDEQDYKGCLSLFSMQKVEKMTKNRPDTVSQENGCLYRINPYDHALNVRK